MVNIEEPQFSSLSARIAALAEQGVGISTGKPTLPPTKKLRPALPRRPKTISNTLNIHHISTGTKQHGSEPTSAHVSSFLSHPFERGQSNTDSDSPEPSASSRSKTLDLSAPRVSNQCARSESVDSTSLLGSADSKLFQVISPGKSMNEPVIKIPPISKIDKHISVWPLEKKSEISHQNPSVSRDSAPKLPSRIFPNIVQEIMVNKIPLKPPLPSRATNKGDQQGKVAPAESIRTMPLDTKVKSETTNRIGDQEKTSESKWITSESWANKGLSQELTTTSIDGAINKKDAFVIFYVRSCPKCQQVKPQWEQLAKNFTFVSDKLIIGHVDLDSYPILRTRYGILSYPTFLLFHGSTKPPEKFIGLQPTSLEPMTEFLESRLLKRVFEKASPEPPSINFSSKPSIQEIQAIQFSEVTSKSSDTCLRCRDFSGPDKIASQYPRQSLSLKTDIIGFLADVLCRPFKFKVDKARAIFTWLHHNISYDVEAFFGNRVRHVEPQDTIASGLAICGGYADVFEAIALKAGLEVITVTGHGKGYGYKPMKPGDSVPPKNPTGHAWNAVRLESGWKLIDSCWGSGTVNGQQYSKKFAPREFTCSNEEFGIRHFPQGDFFFRADGFRPSWEKYMRGLGPTDQEPVQELGNVEDAYGISLTSFSPPQKHISVASSPENVRFQFSKICEHFDFQKHRNGKLPLLLLCLHGSDDPWLPFDNNGFWWWLDVSRTKLKVGQQVGCFALTTIDGHEAGAVTKDQYLQIRGRRAMGFSGVSVWELV